MQTKCFTGLPDKKKNNNNNKLYPNFFQVDHIFLHFFCLSFWQPEQHMALSCFILSSLLNRVAQVYILVKMAVFTKNLIKLKAKKKKKIKIVLHLTFSILVS